MARLRNWVVCLGVILGALPAVTDAQQIASEYWRIDLGGLDASPPLLGWDGVNWSGAFGLSDRGLTAGYSVDHDGLKKPVVWDVNGTPRELPLLVEGQSLAHAVNDAGQVVGSSPIPNSDSKHPVLWSGATIIDLGHLGSGAYDGQGGAVDINNVGQVVGYSWVNQSVRHAFLWEDGVMHDLGAMGEGRNSNANAINASGQVVGESEDPAHADHACIWSNGTITRLDDPDTYLSRAVDINDLGQVVGFMSKDGVKTPFIWQDGVRRSPESLGMPVAINNAGQVLCHDIDPDDRHYFIWDNNSVAYFDEEGLGLWHVLSLEDINDAGEVVGRGMYIDSLQYPGRRAFLLRPIPEPATLSLLAFGGLALMRRRNRRRR